MIFQSVKPEEIWTPENRRYLSYLIDAPFQNSPILLRCLFNSQLKRLFFAMEDYEAPVQGCILVSYEDLGRTAVILRGTTEVFDRFIPVLEMGQTTEFDYIEPADCPLYTERFGSEPSLATHFYETTTPLGEDTLDELLDLAREGGYKIKDIDSAMTNALIGFYRFPVNKTSLAIFSKVSGLYALKRAEIVACAYDTFSLLQDPIQVAIIGGVRVDERERNRGLCRMLTGMLLNRLFDTGHEEIGLFVDFDNGPAISCYERVGFARVSDVYRLRIEKDSG
jgi:hypothetical protein